MKSSELRIGNYLGGRNGIVTVSAIQEDGTVWLKEGGKNFIVDSDKPCLLPIPLTEEWLVKFGFELEKGLYIKYFDGNDFIGIDSEDLSVGTYANGRIAHCPQPSRMTLHQLQNLYFALTNEELTDEQ